MAPVLASLFARSWLAAEKQAIGDLNLSSLELDTSTTHPSPDADALQPRTASTSPAVDNIYSSSLLYARDATPQPCSPVAAHDLGTRSVGIYQRATTNNGYVKGAGSRPASEFSGPGYQVLFALLGTAMVVASIWFFFWAKNGGFHFQENDWDDYKSTVLRRKGPDGKTLSNATKSTKLGGGSVVHGQDYLRAKSVARTVVGKDEKGRKGILAKRGWGKTHSVFSGDDYMTESWGTETVSDDMTELRTEAGYTDNGHSKRYRDRDVHHYKREKPARVGGLNRVADGSHFDYSNTDRSDTYTEASAEPLVSKKPKKERSARPVREHPTHEHVIREHTRSAHEEAERNAKIEAAKMERRWKKEAEEAAAALARENVKSSPKKSATPALKPAAQKQRRESRSSSPRKRDFSYQDGPASEVLSTAYTATNSDSTRTASYYDAYRPKNQDGYSSDAGRTRQSRQSSPKKGRGGREGGYRRGADSDLD